MSTDDLTGRPVYFLGCGNDRVGHFWWAPGHWGKCLRGKEALGLPWDNIDGQHTPKKTHYEKQGAAALVHTDGWTILAFCDRSVDSRPGSNANFVAPGTLSFEEICDLADQYFPKVWARFTYPITRVSEVP